jgi:hypothetical protein
MFSMLSIRRTPSTTVCNVSLYLSEWLRDQSIPFGWIRLLALAIDPFQAFFETSYWTRFSYSRTNDRLGCSHSWLHLTCLQRPRPNMFQRRQPCSLQDIPNVNPSFQSATYSNKTLVKLYVSRMCFRHAVGIKLYLQSKKYTRTEPW